MKQQMQKYPTSDVGVTEPEGALARIARRLFSKAAIVAEASDFESRLNAGEEEVLTSEESRGILSNALQLQGRLLSQFKSSK
jgi:hypothetical protein